MAVSSSGDGASFISEAHLKLIINEFISQIAFWVELDNRIGWQSKHAIFNCNAFYQSVAKLHEQLLFCDIFRQIENVSSCFVYLILLDVWHISVYAIMEFKFIMAWAVQPFYTAFIVLYFYTLPQFLADAIRFHRNGGISICVQYSGWNLLTSFFRDT